MTKIETPQLILREFNKKDAAILADMVQQEHIVRWLPPWPTTTRECKVWIGWMSLHYRRPDYTHPQLMLAVTLRETGEVIGLVGVRSQEGRDSELVCFIEEKSLGQGLGREAVEAFCPVAFSQLRMTSLLAVIHPANHPATAIAQSCGFEKQSFEKTVGPGGEAAMSVCWRRYGQ